MTNSIVPFNFESTDVRTVADDRGVWFVASDVCKVLGLPNVSQAVSRLDTDERDNITTNDAIGRSSDVVIINEAGVYRLIFTSRKEAAERFKRWLAHEVLPSIRKTGGYAVKPLTPAELSLMHAQMLVDHERELSQVKDRLARVEANQAVITGGSEYFTVLGYCKYKGLPALPDNVANLMGRRAMDLSKRKHLPTGKAPDSRYGTVNTYHETVLDELFNLTEGQDGE